jgi:hypothetical protein
LNRPANANIDQVIGEGKACILISRRRLSRADAYRQAGYYHLLKGDLEHDRDAPQSGGGLSQCAAGYRAALRSIVRVATTCTNKWRASWLRRRCPAYLLLLWCTRLGERIRLTGDQPARTLDPLNRANVPAVVGQSAAGQSDAEVAL